MVISVNFLKFSMNSRAEYKKKSENMFFRLKRRQIKAKLEILKFLRISALSQGIVAFDKIGGNYVLSANSIKICLLGYFCMQNSYLQWKQFKILRFSWKMQKNRKMISFGNLLIFWDFHWKTWAEYQKK